MGNKELGWDCSDVPISLNLAAKTPRSLIMLPSTGTILFTGTVWPLSRMSLKANLRRPLNPTGAPLLSSLKIFLPRPWQTSGLGGPGWESKETMLPSLTHLMLETLCWATTSPFSQWTSGSTPITSTTETHGHNMWMSSVDWWTGNSCNKISWAKMWPSNCDSSSNLPIPFFTSFFKI